MTDGWTDRHTTGKGKDRIGKTVKEKSTIQNQSCGTRDIMNESRMWRKFSHK